MLLSWSIAISLAIVLATVRSPVSGFNLRRIEVDIPKLVTDVDVAVQDKQSDLQASNNETVVGSDRAVNTSGSSKTAETTNNKTDITNSSIDLSASMNNIANTTETTKGPMDNTTPQTVAKEITITPIDKSSTFDDNYASPIIIDETTLRGMNDNELTTNIITTSQNFSTLHNSDSNSTDKQKQDNTSLSYNKTQASTTESAYDIVPEADTPKLYVLSSVSDSDLSKKTDEFSPNTTKLDVEVSTVSNDQTGSQLAPNKTTRDINATLDSSTVIPESSSTESLNVYMNNTEPSLSKFNGQGINASDLDTVAQFLSEELKKKFDESSPTTQENSLDKFNVDVLNTLDVKNVTQSVSRSTFDVVGIMDSSTVIPESATKEPLKESTSFDVGLSKVPDDKTVSLSIFNESSSDGTVVNASPELNKEPFEVTMADRDNLTKLEDTPPTTQIFLPTTVAEEILNTDYKTVSQPVANESIVTITSPASNNESFRVPIFDLNTNTTEAYLEERPTATIVFMNTETLHTDVMQTETRTDKPDTATMPSWKKYTTIDRNRASTVNSKEPTSFESEMTRAEAGRISLENVFTNTPIPSLLDLRKDFLNIQDYATETFDVSNVTQISVNSTSNLNKMSEKVETQTKFDIVSSKRAGYIDNTVTTSSSLTETTTTVHVTVTEPGLYAPAYETEANDREISETPDIKNSTSLGSQSQLAEDAMKEELLMEQILDEHQYIQANTHNLVKTSKMDNNTKSDVFPEDTLSVKPIKKNLLALYSVNPNYKPLKKIDVQPAKQFVRDPDDNSWRNESISSLGIVFKPKNASKSFTEVLKNKTTELSNMVEKDDKSSLPDLRVRLEKIAEVRKSKKKKVNMYGDTVYSDYEENSKEGPNVSVEEVTTLMTPVKDIFTTSPPFSADVGSNLMENYIQKENVKTFKEEFKRPVIKGDSYDDTDDYDADYVTKIDLKKFTVPSRNNDIITTQPPIKAEPFTYLPDRQPTVQYFPPTQKVKTSQVNKVITDYDELKNQFTYKEPSKSGYEVPFNIAPAVPIDRFKDSRQKLTPTNYFPPEQNLNQDLYFTDRPRVVNMQRGFTSDDDFNKPTYIIKHYKDVAETGKDETEDYIPLTETSMRGITISDIDKYSPTQKSVKHGEDYDYDAQFRKDIVHRFVDNFNQNSEKFKVDFPILYNNSVVHRTLGDSGKVLASSSTFVKRLYEMNSKPNFLAELKPCDAHCENLKMVDLSPAYELHYYVPEQEEKEEIKPRTRVLPFQYRL